MNTAMLDVIWLPLILIAAQLLAALSVMPLRVHSQPRQLLAIGGLALAYGLAMCQWVLWWRGLTWPAIGLHAGGLPTAIGAGLAGAAGMILLVVVAHGILRALHVKQRHWEAVLDRLMGRDRLSLLAFLTFAALLGGILEEIVFRGLIFHRLLAAHDSAPMAIVISSLMFGGVHFFNQGWAGCIAAALAGMILGGLRHWTGGLAAGMIAHTAANSAVIILFYHGHLRSAPRQPDDDAEDASIGPFV